MTSKRDRVYLTIGPKYEIIKESERGESAMKLVKIHGVGKSRITDIKAT